MKSVTLKIGKVFLSILLCLTILINSIGMFSICNVSNTKTEEKNEEIIVAKQEYNAQETPIVTSRGGIERKQPIIYTFYKLEIGDDGYLFFETLEEAQEKEQVLQEETENLVLNVIEIQTEDNNCLSPEEEIIDTINYYSSVYKKIKTCFPTKSHRISSTFGNRSRGDFHTGIDLSGSYGDNIFAYKSGTIIKTQYSNVSYGNMILIEHEDGTQSRYAHLSSIKVSLGEKVNCGAIIGKMGSTGNSTGNHLHFEIIINGSPVNPYGYIF